MEYLTAAWLLLAGVLLFVTALAERRFFRRCAYVLGGMAMVFAAGEEISWGQRIFGFATPDWLMRLNDQEEFNVHNIVNGLFDIIYLFGVGCIFYCLELLLAATSRTSFSGLKLPERQQA